MLVLFGLTSSCSRGFSSPKGTRELSQACTHGGECASGACVDGVCCEASCGSTQVCNLAGHEGRCADRPLGSACSADAMCPGVSGQPGHCVDGVCCDSACTGFCSSCAVDGAAGHCQLAADNTDPRHDCTATCTACFSGVCGFAFSNSDPHSECGAGQTCSVYVGGCATESGGACDYPEDGSGGDYECALGYCIDGRCLEVDYFHPEGYPLLRTDAHRTPIGAAVGASGAAVVLLDTDDGAGPDGGYLGSVSAVLGATARGPWTIAHVEYNAAGRRHGAAAMVGDVAYLAVESGIGPDDPQAAYGYSGIYVQNLRVDGTDLGYDVSDPGAVQVVQLALAADPDGELEQVAVVDGGELRRTRRGIDGTWADVEVDELGASGAAFAQADGVLRLFYAAGGTLLVQSGDGGAERADGTPGACLGPVNAATVPGAAGDEVGLTLFCVDGGVPYLGAFNPARSDSRRWLFVPAPSSSIYGGTQYVSYDATSYPLSAFLPSGGADGLLGFVGLEPGGAAGAPMGGYAQDFWMFEDGGVYFATATAPDNGYRYVSMASSPLPSGSPMSAFDTVVDDDGGGLDRATLLIQTYFP